MSGKSLASTSLPPVYELKTARNVANRRSRKNYIDHDRSREALSLQTMGHKWSLFEQKTGKSLASTSSTNSGHRGKPLILLYYYTHMVNISNGLERGSLWR